MTSHPPSPPTGPASASEAPGARTPPRRSLRIASAVQRGPALTFRVDGQPVEACAGESVAAALHAAGQHALRLSPRNALPRGPFCLMGSCQECLVWVGQKKLPSCQVPVTAGLEVETLPFREHRHG